VRRVDRQNRHRVSRVDGVGEGVRLLWIEAEFRTASCDFIRLTKLDRPARAVSICKLLTDFAKRDACVVVLGFEESVTHRIAF
jgi:hypothetical protein